MLINKLKKSPCDLHIFTPRVPNSKTESQKLKTAYVSAAVRVWVQSQKQNF